MHDAGYKIGAVRAPGSPGVLAGLEITRRDLARLGHGASCLECKR